MFGARRFTFLMMLLPLTVCISESWAFVRFEVRRRKWLLPPFVRMSLPEPVRRNLFDVALWVLSLVLPAFALRGTAAYSFQTKLTASMIYIPRTLTSLGLRMLEAPFPTTFNELIPGLPSLLQPDYPLFPFSWLPASRAPTLPAWSALPSWAPARWY